MIFELINYLSLIVLFLICFLSIKGKVTFGYGLGDVFFIIGIVIISTLLLIITTYLSIEMIPITYLTLGPSALLLFTILQITIFRGPALPWNGKVFFNF